MEMQKRIEQVRERFGSAVIGAIKDKAFVDAIDGAIEDISDKDVRIVLSNAVDTANEILNERAVKDEN